MMIPRCVLLLLQQQQQRRRSLFRHYYYYYDYDYSDDDDYYWKLQQQQQHYKQLWYSSKNNKYNNNNNSNNLRNVSSSSSSSSSSSFLSSSISSSFVSKSSSILSLVSTSQVSFSSSSSSSSSEQQQPAQRQQQQRSQRRRRSITWYDVEQLRHIITSSQITTTTDTTTDTIIDRTTTDTTTNDNNNRNLHHNNHHCHLQDHYDDNDDQQQDQQQQQHSYIIPLTCDTEILYHCTDFVRQYIKKKKNDTTTTTTTDTPATHDTTTTNATTTNIKTILVQPKTVQQVSKIVHYCYINHIGIIPIGGRTGLVAGTIPNCYYYNTTTTTTTNNNETKDNNKQQQQQQQDQPPMELLLSTRYIRQNSTNNDSNNNNNHNNNNNTNIYTDIHFSNTSNIVQCPVGYTLLEIQEYLQQYYNTTFPCDIGSKGSCTIGGIVATNAGGSYYTRYHSLLANVIGIQFVNGTGHIYHWNYYYTNHTDTDHTSTTNTNTTNNAVAVISKNNTGYKLIPLLIGSEGTLGIITGVTIQCTPYLPHRQTMMIIIQYNNNHQNNHNNNYNYNQCSTQQQEEVQFETVLSIVQLAKQCFGEILAAVEWMDPNIIHMIHHQNNINTDNNNNSSSSTNSSTSTKSTTTTTSSTTKLQQILSLPTINEHSLKTTKASSILLYPHCILIETHGTVQHHDEEKCDMFFTKLMEFNDIINTKRTTNNNDSNDTIYNNPISIDVRVGKNDSDRQYLWSIRESANPTVSKLGYTYKYDVSIPNSNFYSFIHRIYDRIYNTNNNNNNIIQHKNIIITNWGHILDGNLHLNITDIGCYYKDEVIVSILEPYIYEQVIVLGGSISAEHGIGLMKSKYLNTLVHTPETISIMKQIKHIFDPKNILNPGKVLPSLSE